MADVIVAGAEYRDIEGFPGYRVGSDGSVWSRRSINGKGPLKREWRLLKQAPRPNGYLTVSISPRQGLPQQKLTVHRLVSIAFHRAPQADEVVRHLDGNKKNNSQENLKWGTIFENAQDSIQHGVQVRGDSHRNSKVSESQVMEIRNMKASGFVLRLISMRFGISMGEVSKICRGELFRHVGGPLTKHESRCVA